MLFRGATSSRPLEGARCGGTGRPPLRFGLGTVICGGGIIRANLGYDPQNVTSVGIPVHQNAHVSWEDGTNSFEQLREHIAALPEAVSAGEASIGLEPERAPAGQTRKECPAQG